MCGRIWACTAAGSEVGKSATGAKGGRGEGRKGGGEGGEHGRVLPRLRR